MPFFLNCNSKFKYLYFFYLFLWQFGEQKFEKGKIQLNKIKANTNVYTPQLWKIVVQKHEIRFNKILYVRRLIS